tara:strand:+ start:3010 stop:3648 length:639 start_codon:yes stop_codon:yes gene_type:complete
MNFIQDASISVKSFFSGIFTTPDYVKLLLEAKNEKDMYLGAIEFSDYITITDPSNDRPTPEKGKFSIEKGTWHGLLSISDEGIWGNRVESLNVFNNKGAEILHKINLKNLDHFNDKFECDSINIAVDSGQLGIFDWESFPEDSFFNSEFTDLYNKACEITESNFGGLLSEGFISCSGFGDGYYTVNYLRDKSTKKIVLFDVEFINDENRETM